MALQEALDNALYHGNLEISSDLREQDPGLYYRSAEERRVAPPYASRQIFVSVDESPEHVTYRIRDEGPGFDPAHHDDWDQNNAAAVSDRAVSASARSSNGLANMRDRVGSLGGSVVIDSSPDGTVVSASIPISR